MNKKLVLTHANCVDGCCSRAILESHYGSDAHYIAVDHIDYNPKFKEQHKVFLEQVKDVKDTEIIMADICLPTDWIEMFLANGNKVTVMDHHKTAVPVIEGFEERIKNGENLNIEFYCSKENTASGAMLAWKHTYRHQPVPDTVVYISEGDRWDFQHTETKHFYAGLLEGKQPKDYPPEYWMELLNNPQLVSDIVSHGKPIYETFMAEVANYASQAVPVTLQGKNGLMVFALSQYRSEVGNALALASGGFGLIIEEKDGVVSCGLRSVEPFTVDEIAQKFGGGGHGQAASFKLANLDALQSILNQEGNDINLNTTKNSKFKNG